MSTLSALPNVGKVLEKNLIEVGIKTPEQLRETGSKEVFLKIRMIDSGACLHMLYGLQGAIEGVRDSHLGESVKNELKAFYKSL